VVAEMTAIACEAAGIDTAPVEDAVWAREEALSTGIGNGVALPHARIEGLKAPVIVAGISSNGIDFDAPDGRLADVIFLMLTPKDDPGAQLEIASDIARLFRHPETLSHAHSTKNYTDFLALMKTDGVEA
jgi:mannitol/fructose-specific phosphotransferase system IIA component (Ntr-type)